ncbi:MAG: hypothetical protein HYY59_07800 [Candidatus Omnitrophica bacterium]|nr:hypothetical protein [Candidatus Omnitrophota bacterium]MBI3021885.1 hypothetical protein [Candidatus Omnitrophota bacterium]
MTAFVITLLLTPLVRLTAVRFGWIVKPAESRWGRRVVARLGGVAMFIGFVATTALWVPWERSVLALLGGVSLVYVVGLVDDFRRIPPYAKLLAQLLIGCVIVLSGIRLASVPWAWVSIPLSVLWFVFVMNAFNLLDNMDGLAAGVGAIAAGFCVLHAALSGQWVVATLAGIVSGVCLGFLRYNFPPAKIFMGDSGSHLLGLSLATVVLMESRPHSTQLVSILAVPALVLAVPIFDTCFVTVQRLLHRLHPFAGGIDHVSHRLAILGLSPRQTVIVLYGASAALGGLSVFSTRLSPLPAIAMWLLVLVGLILCGRYLARVNVYRLQPAETPAARMGSPPVTLIETMLLHKRRLVEVLVDFGIVSSVYVFAHLLRFEGALTSHLQSLLVRSLPIILVGKLICFAGCGLYRRVWRYPDLSDLLAVFKAVSLGSILSSIALLYLWRFEGYSRAVLIIDWMLCLLAIGGSRVVERVLDEWISAASNQESVPVLILGAGETGERVLRFLRLQGRGTRRAVGFLDDDWRKQGNQLHRVRVLGTRERLAAVLAEYGVREVLIAISDPPGDLLQHVRQCCEPRGIAWKMVTADVTDAV